MKTNMTGATCAFALSLVASIANAALIDRGGGLIYDTDLNITWLQDTSLAATNTFGVSRIAANGAMDWGTTQSWIAAMNTANYLGYNDWRLPTVTDTGAPGCDFAYSGTDCGYNVDTATGEMAHLFYNELGNKAYYNTAGVGPQAGWSLTQNTGPFINLQPTIYWSGTPYYAPNSGNVWQFYFQYGKQTYNLTSGGLFALAVRPGDVAAVPVPAAVWLFGSGLLGLIGVARPKAA